VNGLAFLSLKARTVFPVKGIRADVEPPFGSFLVPQASRKIGMGKIKGNQKPGKITKPSPLKTQRKWHSTPFLHLLAGALIAATALVVYSNTFRVSFRFDDIPNILDNPSVQMRALSLDHLEGLFKDTYRESIRVFSYFTFALNYYWGEFDVRGYHLVNLLIHITSGILLYWFLILTLNLPSLRERYGSISNKIALFTSLIFISHPIQTQSVTYVVQRMTSMAGMFYLLSLVLYVKGRLSAGWVRYAYLGGMGLSYLLGIFSKENVAVLPVVIALYEFYFFQNRDLSHKGKKVLSILVGILFVLGVLIFAIWGERYLRVIQEGYAYRTFTMSERILTQFRVVLYYLTLLIYPHPSRLNLDYDFSLSKTIFDPVTTLISILIIAGLIVYGVWMAKKRPVLSFCILWFFINLAIESSIFPLEMVYEHRLYIPSVGAFLLFSVLVTEGMRRIGEKKILGKKFLFAEVTVLGVVIVFLAAGSYLRNRLWTQDINFWADCVKKSPQKARPYVNVGYTYLNQGDYEKALDWTQKAIGLDPKYSIAYYNLSIIFEKMGDLNQALTMGERALEIEPKLYRAYYALGKIYLRIGRCERAEEAFRKYSITYDNSPDVHNYLGITYLCQKQYEKAKVEFERVIQNDPRHLFAHLNLGQIYWNVFQNREKALYYLKTGLNLDPFFADRGEILTLIRRIEGAQQRSP
jgi:tetratricopeptide (TPR) repeat protein